MNQIRQIQKRFSLSKCIMLLLLFTGVFEGRAEDFTFMQYSSTRTVIVNNANVEISECDSWTSRNRGICLQTHGLPRQNTSKEAVFYVNLSTSGKRGQGVKLKYNFVKKHVYKISIVGKRAGGDFGYFAVKLANGLVENENTDCTPFGDLPTATSIQDVYKGATDWNGFSTQLLLKNDNGIPDLVSNNNYSDLWLYVLSENDNANSSYSIEKVSIIDMGDPDEPINSISTNGIRYYETLDVKNLKIDGNLPTRGGINGQPPINGYKYQWQIYNNGWTNINGATQKDYILGNVTSKITKLRRVVITNEYTHISNEVTISLIVCLRGSLNSKTICDNQTYYNVPQNTQIWFKNIIGSQFDQKKYSNGSVLNPSEDFGETKVVWRKSSDNINFELLTQSRTINPWNRVYDEPFISDLYNYSIVTSNSSNVNVIYIRREVETRNPYCWFNRCDWKNQETSNSIRLATYTFENPDLANLSIKGSNIINCQNSSGIYQLFDNKTNALVNLNSLGIQSITWAIPSTWESTVLTGTNITPNYFKTTANSNVPQGGRITATVAFLDGKTKTVNLDITVNVALDATYTPGGTITLCQYSPIAITANGINGSGNYEYTWNKTAAQCVAYTNCKTVTVDAVDIVVDFYGENFGFKVKDQTTNCYINKKPTLNYIGYPGSPDTWNAYTIYTGASTQFVAKKDISDIVVDKSGTSYYVGNDNKIYYYRYVNGVWQNAAIAGVNNANGKLCLYEPTAGNRTIYYQGTITSLNKLNYISATGNSMSFSQNQVYPGASSAVTGAIRVNSSGQPYYISGAIPTNATIKTVVNGVEVTVFTSVNANIDFEIVGNNKFYYAHTYTNLMAVSANIVNNVVTKRWLLNAMSTSPQLLENSNIIADNNGNVFVVDNSNYLFRIDAITQELDLSTPINNYTFASGKFTVNKQTGTVYLTGSDKNIYQLHYANGKWNTPFLLSFISNTYAEKSIGKDYPTTWGAYGNMVFSNPNIFYISTDGYVRVVQYNTNNTCIAPHVRMGNNDVTALVEDIVLYPNPTNNTDATIKFSLSEAKTIDLVLRNSLGELVQSIVNNQQYTEGAHEVLLNTQQLSPGIYFVTYTKNNTESQTIKVIVNQ